MISVSGSAISKHFSINSNAYVYGGFPMIVLNFLLGFHLRKSSMMTSSAYLFKFPYSSSLISNAVIWLFDFSLITFTKFPFPALGSSMFPFLSL